MSNDWSFGSQVPTGEAPVPPSSVPHPEAIAGAACTYRIVELLGEGGAGRVYRALDPAGRQVALKLLMRTDPDDVERFVREGRVAAAIRHPNVIAIHEAGTTDQGRPFLVYELVEGELSFAGALRSEPLEVRLDLLRAVFDGVAAAHHLGVIHRDLKPANVLLGADRRPRVADFGLGLGEQDERLTVTGALLGTPSAMAPEQVRGERDRQGPPTDVWALGVMLYEALTGQPPFTATSLPDMAALICEAAPTPPRRLNPAVSPALERVCLRALAKRPEDRYGDAGQLCRALIAARRPPRRRTLPVVLLVSAILLGAGVGGALALWRRSPEGQAGAPAGARPKPDPVAARVDAIDREFKAKRYAHALEMTEALLTEHPDSLEARLTKGEILCQTQRYAEAIAAFDRARELDPDNLRALVGSGASKARLGRVAEGLDELNRAVALDPNSADALRKRSITNYERDAFRAALDDAQRALALQPDSAEGLNFRGLARGALGDMRGAIDDFEQAYAKVGDPNILANLGAARMESGQAKQGLKDVRRSLALQPNNAAAWASISVYHFRRKQYAEALAAIQRAVKLEPKIPTHRFSRAVVLYRLGRLDEAERDVDWLLRTHPNTADADRARDLRRSIRRRRKPRRR